ncbi:winged helix DNA-binding protein [Parabacteroides bouchesdurhonensis]|mgnify:CR=1 FL=1|uniref:winged helix DNA-binding protein n=1 Tax=Parabacteroides bouchesdurhonensis TaxID=1936995 RepID=UPI000C83250C|nr:winged helix DNA-binding protein [Parabacteroides bouchesdurhonensis]RHJ92574.1 MarR family transcriptional regulator [Bacteroides sp. AM07-16]
MEEICAIKDIYKTLYTFEKTFAENNDITINEAMLLCCLKDGESKSAGTISEYIGLSNSRVSKVITSVENKGYIRRNINKNDKRQMFFSLTLKGKEKIQLMTNKELHFDILFKQLQSCIQKG